MSKTVPAQTDRRELYRLIYTTPEGEELPSEPGTLEFALLNFDLNVETTAEDPLHGKERVRVMAESEWQKHCALARGAS